MSAVALQPDDLVTFAAKYFAEARDGKKGGTAGHAKAVQPDSGPVAIEISGDASSDYSDAASVIYGTSVVHIAKTARPYCALHARVSSSSCSARGHGVANAWFFAPILIMSAMR